MNKNINKISPDVRDSTLIRNSGKYFMVSEMLSVGIGDFNKIYNNTNNHQFRNKDILQLTNDGDFPIDRGELSINIEPVSLKLRDKTPIVIDYSDGIENEYYYTDGNRYGDNGNFYDNVIGGVVGALYGDSVTLDLSNNSVGISSSSLETSTSLTSRIIEETTVNPSKIGKIGLKALGLAHANTLIQETSSNVFRELFYNDKTHGNEDLAQIDSDIMGLINKIPGVSNITDKLFPIYFYEKVKENTFDRLIGRSNDINWDDVSGNGGFVEHSIINNGDEHLGYIGKREESGLEYKKTSDYGVNTSSILNKTNKMFKSGRIKTMINKIEQFDDGKRIAKGRMLMNNDSGGFIRN